MSMRPAAPRSGVFASFRFRVVAIAVIPSLIFVCAVVGVGWYQSGAALSDRATAVLVGQGIDATVALSTSAQDERRTTVEGTGDVSAARRGTDAAIAGVRSFMSRIPATAPSTVRDSFARLSSAAEALIRARRVVDAGARGTDAYEAYEPVIEPLTTVIGFSTAGPSDLDVIAGLGAAGHLLAVAESLRSADLVVATDGPRGLDIPAYRELNAEAGQIGEAMQNAVAALPANRRDAGAALLDSPEWRTFTADTELLLAAGPHVTAPASGDQRPDGQLNPVRVPVDRTVGVVGDLTAAGDAVAASASDLAFGAARDAVATAVDRTNTELNVIVGLVLGAVAIVVAAMLVAMRTGNRLGRRMAALRATTHGTSARLPAVLERIRRGEPVDVEAEFPAVDHGVDEIGEVGAAVDIAQRSAAAAAAEEARTRAGANAVFLNIAHRSQAIVHRQLQVLDEAERAEDNSDQLARLFQLDHLSTRERRNAENLIIMGGQQPRRRWRRPVLLAEIIRSAVSESEQYTRITLGEVPDRHVDGAAVGDLIHLLAELVDNATSFSPPQCPIDISASVVGRGVAVEIEDRGLGIEPEPRDRLNEMLADPPDFGLLTLSEDARLGMFVVSRLAQRHGMRVTLLESTYGGVQALVLVPNTLLVAPPGDDEPQSEPEPQRRPSVGSTGSGVPFGRGTNGRHPHSNGSSGRNGRNGSGPHREAYPVDGPGPDRNFAEPGSARRRGDAAALPSRRPSTPAPPAGPAAGGKPALPERTSAAAATPDAVVDDVVAVDLPAAEVAATDVPSAQPDSAQRDGAQRDGAQPDGAQPDGAQPDGAQPDGAQPGADAADGPAGTDDAPPPLPERRPQGHLAKGLRGRLPADLVPGGAAPVEPAAGRTSSAMSAMQRGVRSSRKDSTDDGGHP